MPKGKSNVGEEINMGMICCYHGTGKGKGSKKKRLVQDGGAKSFSG